MKERNLIDEGTGRTLRSGLYWTQDIRSTWMTLTVLITRQGMYVVIFLQTQTFYILNGFVIARTLHEKIKVKFDELVKLRNIDCADARTGEACWSKYTSLKTMMRRMHGFWVQVRNPMKSGWVSVTFVFLKKTTFEL